MAAYQPAPVVPLGFDPLVAPLPARTIPPGFLPHAASMMPATPHVAQSSPVAPGTATPTPTTKHTAPKSPVVPCVATVPPVATDGPPPCEWLSTLIVYAKRPQ
jgi:hypothetical protein